MPYASVEKRRKAARVGMAKGRAAKKARAPAAKITAMPATPSAQVKALADWSAAKLKIPPGHPNAGSPLILPDFAQAFLVDALSNRWSLLCMARKNAKSAICAVLALGYLVGAAALAWLARGGCQLVERKSKRTAGPVRSDCKGEQS